jgi:hypothetical protein
MAAPALDTVSPAGGDEIEADEHKQAIIQSYIAEFKDKGCVNTVVRLLREILPEHIYIHLINAVDKEGSILTVLVNAVRIYIALMYVAPTMPSAPPGAPPGAPPPGAPQQAPQQPQDMQNAIVQQVLAKVLEKQLGGEDEGGGGFDLRGMMKQMLAMMFMPMMQQMMQRMQASMMSSMMQMPGMPNMPMPPMPNMANTNQQQQPQQQPPQQQLAQADQKNVQRLDIL